MKTKTSWVRGDTGKIMKMRGKQTGDPPCVLPRSRSQPSDWPERLRTWLGMLLLLGLGSISPAVAAEAGRVVVYTSQDQTYAEPILREFERRTGLRADAVYDSEAVKTVGLANRLLAERHRPQCDVFWSNEELRMRQLAAQQVFARENWFRIGYRSRRLVVNTNHLDLAAAPKSLLELTNRVWERRLALAYPLFGTTATHFLALRQKWGPEKWERWCRSLAANQPFLVDGNSVAAKMVARGEAWIGLTDSDNILAEQREGAPIAALPVTEETLLIPNTVGIVTKAPHPETARKLADYLREPEVIGQLIAAGALEGLAPTESTGQTLQPSWDVILAHLKPGTESLKRIFLR